MTPEEKLDLFKKDNGIYFHDDSVAYMLSHIVRGIDKNCDGIGRIIGKIAQETEYKCDKCGKVFVTEGE